jgi:hypothetical protein
MTKLAYFVCALLAALFVTQTAYADELADVQAKIVTLEKEHSALTAAIAATDAKIAEATKAAAPAQAAEPQMIIIGHFTAATPAEGWMAWQRQSAAYKRAHPWEGERGVWCENSKRLGISCDPKVMDAAWRKMPTGTMFYLPAPETYVYVPAGAKAPEALALVPLRENTNLLRVQPPSVPVVTKAEKLATAAAELNAAALAEKTAALAASERSATNTKIVAAALIVLALMLGIWVFMLKSDISALESGHRRAVDDLASTRRTGDPHTAEAKQWPWEEKVVQNDSSVDIKLTPEGEATLNAGSVTIPPASASERPEATGEKAHQCGDNCGHDHKHKH